MGNGGLPSQEIPAGQRVNVDSWWKATYLNAHLHDEHAEYECNDAHHECDDARHKCNNAHHECDILVSIMSMLTIRMVK